jgi:hypothetical protein
LGGSQLIKESSEAELEEIKRICENVSALIDSELTAPEAAIEPGRAAFVEKCSGGDKRPENQTPKEFDIFDPRAKYQAS